MNEKKHYVDLSETLYASAGAPDPERIDRLLEDEVPFSVELLCGTEGAGCSWVEETVGYEEAARTVWVCETHGTER